MFGLGLRMAEAGFVPDPLVRAVTRQLLRARLRESVLGDSDARAREESRLIARLSEGPIAISVDAANAQHYQVPPAFFERVLGPRLKYSSGFWDSNARNLADAEEAMLTLTASRAGIEDGMRVLDLGCGWGSFALWAAEHYPNAEILAVSNSSSQRTHILSVAAERGLGNLEVETSDINDFQPGRAFDRIVSIEMMEHVRNHRLLFHRLASWLAPGGSAFAHIFCHRSRAYTYENDDPSDWMARTFFTGGMMPSETLFHHYQDDLVLRDQWRVSGVHYHRTCEAWLRRLDCNRDEVLPILRDVYGSEARRWFHRWRLFFIACSELFAYDAGAEWFVAHYRWERRV